MRRNLLAVLLTAWALSGWTNPSPTMASPAPEVRIHAGKPELQPRTPLLERPWTTDPQKFSFVIIGDKTGGGERNWPIFDRVVDEINFLHPDFAIMVGDMIPGHMWERQEWERQWREFFEHANRLTVPLFLLPGNHDISNPEMYEWWKQDFGRTYYSFDYKGCHFLVLNTDEDRLGGKEGLWEAQMEFLQSDLAGHADARYTFVFMHKPMWSDLCYERDWPSIEAALGERHYSVFAGHEHNLQFERRNGRRYIVVGPTGAGGFESATREVGEFHHYTWVAVDGDSVRLAIIEPGGPMWPEDIAPRSFQEAVSGLVRVDARPPEGLNAPVTTVRTVMRFEDALPDTATITVRFLGIDRAGWRMLRGGEDSVVVVAPGERKEREFAFSVPAGRLLSPPIVRSRIRYGREGVQFVDAAAVPVFPDSVMKRVPEWMVVGPFDIGPILTRFLPDSPRVAMPRLFEPRGPEGAWNPDATFDEAGQMLRWKKAESQSGGFLNYNGLLGTRDHALGYALCSVYSPIAQQVYAELRADNFAQIVLNGQLLEKGQVYGGAGLYTPLDLKAGWNALLVKLVNNSGDWWLRFLIADPAGTLRFASHPE